MHPRIGWGTRDSTARGYVMWEGGP